MSAPARMNSSASRPVRTPPIPIIGISGRASRTCQIHRTATGRIPGPDKPPVIPASTGRMVSGSIAIPSNVLIIARPSAPAATHERATVTISVTSGDSLANTGMSYLARPRTASMTDADASGSHANTCPRSATFGHEMFTSIAVTPAASDRRPASSAYSSTLPPAMDTIARAPRDSSQGRSRWRNASMPGLCRPIELSMPLSVSTIRGVGRPARGSSMTDLVTTPPIFDTSKNCESSRPDAAQPEAVRMGFGNSTWPSLARMSTSTSRLSTTTARLQRFMPRVRGATGTGPPSRGAQRVEGDHAHVFPADLVSTEYRPIHARPHHARDAVTAPHRQHTGHAYPDAASHRLLNRGKHRDVVLPCRGGDLPQHRHRPARVDDIGPCLVDDLAEHVGDHAAHAERAVFCSDHSGLA